MAEIQDEKERKELYRLLLNDPATRNNTLKYSFKQWESKMLGDEENFARVADYAVKKSWALDKEDFLYKYAPEKAAPAPKVQAPPAPKAQVAPIAPPPVEQVAPPVGIAAPKPVKEPAPSVTDITRQMAFQPPVEAPVEPVQMEPQGFFEGLGTQFKRGLAQGRAIQSVNMGQLRDAAQGKNLGAIPYEQIAAANKAVKEFGQTQSDIDLATKEGVIKDAWDVVKALPGVTIESLASLGRSGLEEALVGVGTGAAAGSIIPGLGTAAGGGLGATAGMVQAGRNMEYFGTLMQELEANGVDITDARQLREGLAKYGKSADKTAITRANTIAAVESALPIAGKAAGALAGRVGSKVAQKPLQAVSKALTYEPIAGPLGGATGELAAQVASGQPISPQEIALEAGGESAATVAAVAKAIKGEKKTTDKVLSKIQQRNKIAQAMEEAVKANPEAAGQIRQQYQKRINEAAPTDEEVLSAYESLSVLPETEEKNAIRENLEGYMAEKGIAPQAEAVTAEEVTAPEAVTETAPIEELPPVTEEAPATTGMFEGIEGPPMEEAAPVAPAEEEVVTEEIPAEPVAPESAPEVVSAAPVEEAAPEAPAAPAPKGRKRAAPVTPALAAPKKEEGEVQQEPRAAQKIAAISPTNLQVFKGVVTKDLLKPKMQGVYFDKANQKIVATDGMNMVVVDRDVKSDVIIDPKTGQVIKETFPDYQTVIPTDYTKGVRNVSINDLLGKLDAIIKGDKERTENAFATITFDGEQVGITPKVLKAGLKALKDLGYETASIEYEAPNKPLLIKTKDGKTLLLTMPTFLREDKAEGAISIGEFTLEDTGKPKAEPTPAPETKEGKKAEAKEEKVTPAPKKGVFADLTEIGGIKFGKNGVAKAVPIKGRIEKVKKAMGVDGIFKIYTLSTQYGVPIEVFGDIDNFVDGKPIEGSEVSFTANVRNLDYRLRVIGPKTEYKQPKPETTTKEEKPAPAAQPTPPKGKGATILPSVDADKADAQLYILQSNNYYTLWYKRKQVDEKTGKTLWSYSNYLTILSQDLDGARAKALDYLNKIASGEFLSTAFVGKNTQGLTDAKTIALQEGVLTPETQPISKSKTPGVEKTFGIGKYSNLTIDELLDKDPDYAQWFVNNYTSRGAEQTKAIIKGDPRYQDYINIKRDIEELERARIEAYEAREAERKAGGKVKVATLVRGEEGEIKEVIEETEVPKKKVEKKERRLVKDQITDIVPPQAKAEDKVDVNLKPQMFAAQINGANTAIASLDKYGVVLNGDGAGVGKTRQIIAVAKYYADKGKPVVIISENAALGKPFEGGKKPALGGSMAKDSEAMGVPLTLLTDDEKVQPGGIYVSTYNRIQDADVPEGAIVIFDESHNLVNTFGRTPGGEEIEEERQWEAKFRPMLKKAGAVAYYTATPADKPHQLAYLYKVLGFNSPEDFLSEMMLNGAVIKERKFGRTKIKYYDVPKSKAGRTNLYKWVNGLMVKAGEQGRFIKREISYEGTDVQFQDIKGTDENKNEYAKEFNKVLDDMSDAEMMDYRLLAPGSYILYAAELSKIGEAVNIVKKQLAQGRKSIIFVSRINPMEIRGRREQFDGELGGSEVVGEIPSPVPMLEEALRKEGISFVGLHSKAKTTSQKAQKQFAEEADVLIASLESGGTGINLDDTVGDNPRTEVFLFSPYRGISTIQGMGRIWRASTIQNDNNPNRYIFVTASDIAPDLKRSGVLAKKLQLMNAAIGGTAVSKLPMSKVSYSSEELVGIELPDDADEESAIFREKTGILKPVSIKWNISRKGGYFADATADLLEWMERGGPERTGLDVRVFKTEEGKWIALAGKDYKAEEFAPENIANEPAPSFTSQQSSEAATAFDKAKTSKGFDKKYGKGAYKALSDITKNFEDIMDKVSEKIKQDCIV